MGKPARIPLRGVCVYKKKKKKTTKENRNTLIYIYFFHCCSWCVISKAVFLRISSRWQDYHTYLMFISSLPFILLLPQGCWDLYSFCCCTWCATDGARRPIGSKQCYAPISQPKALQNSVASLCLKHWIFILFLFFC